MAYYIMDTYFGGLNVEDWFKSKWMREKNKKELLRIVDLAIMQTETDLGVENDEYHILSQLEELKKKLSKVTPKEGKVPEMFVMKLDLGMKGVFPEPEEGEEIELEDDLDEDIEESVQLPETEYEKFIKIYDEILKEENKVEEALVAPAPQNDPKAKAADAASLAAKKKAIDALKAKKKKEGKNLTLNAQTMNDLSVDELNAAVKS